MTSYANRIDKGTHRAIDRVQQFAKRFTYFLPCDVEQFFPAMDHAILLNVLKAKWVFNKIIAFDKFNFKQHLFIQILRLYPGHKNQEILIKLD